MEKAPDEKEPSPTLTPNAENSTHFDPSEVNGTTPINYKRLQLLNRGTWNSRYEENKEVTHRQDNEAILDAVCGQLQLTDYQKKESKRILEDLDLQDIGKKVRLVAFGICVVVANRDARDGKRYHPQSPSLDPLFEDTRKSLKLSKTQTYSIMGILSQEIDNE